MINRTLEEPVACEVLEKRCDGVCFTVRMHKVIILQHKIGL